MVWGFCPHAIPSWLGFPTPCVVWYTFQAFRRLKLELCDYLSMSVSSAAGSENMIQDNFQKVNAAVKMDSSK